MSIEISSPEKSANLSDENEVRWNRRLSLFLRAELSMRRFQLIYAISSGILFTSLSLIGFALIWAKILSAFLFQAALIVALISGLTALLIKPSLRLSRTQRNALSRKFYQHHLRIEFQDDRVLLRHIRSSKIIINRAKYG